MKTNFYIFLIVVLSFSFSNAQSTIDTPKQESKEVVTSSTEIDAQIDTLKLKDVISKTSDIKNYLNMERKVENIKLVFPKINRRKIA